MTRILLMGPPGSGKGTQAVRIAADLGVPAISTGDLFRAEVREQTELGIRMQSLIASGHYVPDEVTNAIVQHRLDEDDTEPGFILDGYPRTLPQLEELDRFLGERERRLEAAVLLSADVDEIVARLAARAAEQNRSDDTPDVIQHRIRVYEAETAPLAEVFTARGILMKIPAEGHPEAIAIRIREALGQLPLR